MKKSLLFLLCFLWSIFIFAQHELNQQYLVYLYDGSFLKGELVGEDQQSIQLKMINGEVLNLPLTLVQKISANNKNQVFLKNGITIQESGPYHIISGGILLGQEAGFSDGYAMGVSLSYIYGHQFNQYAALGAGISLDSYDKSFIPIYLDFRGYILHRATSLFYSVDAGYSFAFDQFKKNKDDNPYKGGMMINPGLGLRFAGKQNYSFLMGIGYRFQFAKRKNTWSEFTDEIIYKRLTLNMGFLF